MCEKFEPSEGFIAQTANDYDIPVEIARDIINKDPDNMYDNLESYLKERRNSY